MRKLLSANFARLKKDRTFWVCMVFMFGFGVFIVLSQYRDVIEYGLQLQLDNIFFGHALLIGVFCAAFCSLFLGTEYSDGTIRNKLVIGHARNAIYFSNLIVSIAAALLMCLAYIAAVSVLGVPLLGALECDWKIVLIMLLGCAAMTIAFCSLCTMLSMLNQNKAIVAVISIIGVFVLLMAAAYIHTMLNAPEFYDGYVLDSLGNTALEKIPNEAYLRGAKRAFYEFLLDFLPTGQGLQYSGLSAVHLWRMPLYSVIISVLSTAAGVLAFQRKDLK